MKMAMRFATLALVGLSLVGLCHSYVHGTQQSVLQDRHSDEVGMEEEFSMPVDFKRTMSLSHEEFRREHERLKSEMGDAQYLAMRKAEMKAHGEILAKDIVSTGCMDGKAHTPERDEMDVRLYIQGREFKVGKGVPQNASDAIQNVYDQYDEMPAAFVDMPVELLQYEVTKEQQQREQDNRANEAKRRQAERDADILSGKVSVRDMHSPCDCYK